MIIGLSGLAGSGKDTVANVLADKYSFVRVALADVIKRYCMELYDFSYDQLWGESNLRNIPDKRYLREHHVFSNDNVCECCGYDLKTTIEHQKCYLTPRYALQRFGGEGGRAAYDDVWVNYTMKIAEKLLADVDYSYKPHIGLIKDVLCSFELNGIVISDCRYSNELNAIKQRNGKIVRIVRSGAGLKGPAANHSSESEQLEIPDSMFDYILYNNDSFDNLLQRIEVMCNSWH